MCNNETTQKLQSASCNTAQDTQNYNHPGNCLIHLFLCWLAKEITNRWFELIVRS